MKLAQILSVCLLTTLFAGIQAFAEKPAPGVQVASSSPVTNGESLQYWIYLPKDYDSSKPAPLLIFLHGSGERGNNLDAVLKHGPPKRIHAGDDFPFIVVSPQCPKGQYWKAEDLQKMLVDLKERFPVDQKRIYLTGLSMGGYGSWAWAAEKPMQFAAVVPICGGGDPETAESLAKVPIWVFHGAKDGAVPLKRSEEMVEAIKAKEGDVTLTIYPEAGHDSWTESYDNPKLYEWLLSHHR